MKNDFYVYAYIDPRTDEPFYIGKGRGNRDNRHLIPCNLKRRSLFSNKLRKMGREGVVPLIRHVADNLSESAAFEMESFLIMSLGRRDDKHNHGPLCNLTNGGEGTSGLVVSTPTRLIKSAITKKRYEDTDERAKQSVRMKKRFEDPIVRVKIGAATKKALEDPIVRVKIGAATKKRFEDPAERAKQSEVQKKRYEDPNERSRTSTAIAESLKDPAVRLAMSRVQKKRFEDPNERIKQAARMKKALEDPTVRAKMSVASQSHWEEPGYRDTVIAAIRARCQTETHRTMFAEVARKRWENEEYRARISQLAKDRAEQYKEATSLRFREMWQDTEHRERMSHLSRERWEDQDYREARLAEGKARWQDPVFKAKQRETKQLAGPKRDSKTGIKGVSPTPTGYTMHVTVNRKVYTKGFASKRHAARVYDAIVRVLHGGVTYVNIPMAPEWWED